MKGLLAVFILLFLKTSVPAQILFGLNNFHGLSNGGTIIRFDVTTNDLTVVKKFDNNSGQFLDGSMMQACDGKLYGMTEYGGIKDFGVIFSFDPVNLTYTKLKEFDYPKEGTNPSGGLIQIAG